MAAEKKKHFWKYKRFWLIIILIIAVIAAVFILRAVKMRQNITAALEAKSIQEATVTKSTIKDTIEGSGTLQVADTQEIYIPSGLTASEILVEAGDTVKAGDVLAYIDDDSILDQLVSIESSINSIEDSLDADDDDDDELTDLEEEQLNNKKEALEKLQDELTALRNNPVVTASADGTIGQVSLQTTNDSKSGSSASGAGSSASAITSMTSAVLSGSNTSQSTLETKSSASQNTASFASEITLISTGSSENAAELTSDGEEDTIQSIVSFSKIPESGFAAPDSGSSVSDLSPKEFATTEGYKISAEWNAESEKFEAGKTYTADVTLKADDGYKFDETSVAQLVKFIESTYEYDSYQSVSEQCTDSQIVFTISFTIAADPTPEPTAAPTTAPTATPSATATVTPSVSSTSTSASIDTSGLSASSASVSSGTASVGSTATGTSSSSLYSSYKTAAFTINKSDNVAVSITVDELDILSVSVGQKATVTLDAISGQEFEGEITEVSDTASSSGGNSKYTVKITVPKTEDMRIGMSATALITISEAKDVLTIPMNALQQRGSETFVYTEQDDEGNLSGDVTVETGLSDDSTVEIKSGLSEGDTVYYTRSDSSSDSSMSFGGFDFGSDMPSDIDVSNLPSGGDMPSGGMPSGGSMPSGGFGGN